VALGSPDIKQRLSVYVQPRASKNELVGLHDGVLKVRLTAPPVEGAANEALTRFIAELVGVPRRQVTVVSGSSGRRKILEIEGASPTALARLGIDPQAQSQQQ
jgi:uncharacterized protein (TIGR00251 family)